MSWHHEDYISLFSAIGGVLSAAAAAFAAGLSLKVARESREQQKISAKFEMERHFYELLLSDATRSNDNGKGIESSEWTYAQAANITYAIESARKRLEAAMPQLDGEQIDRFKSFFIEQLSHEVKSELKDKVDTPDILYKPKWNWQESRELIRIWERNKVFF